MEFPTMQTEHLVLKGWRTEDAEALFDILQEDGILDYFPNPTPPARTWADDYIAHHLAHWKQFGYGHWAVSMREDNRVVGWAGLEYLPDLGETEVAYLLSRHVWGRGYATEAARAAVRFGFKSAGLDRIIGLVHPENIGSRRVLEKCGMTLSDRLTLWGLEMSRYRVDRAAYEEQSREAAGPGLQRD
jgi:RimJ/RimL family protein N-acetyltransferase